MQSCGDDFLEETNPNAISASIYWSSLEESESNLTSVYGAMLNNFLYSLDMEAWRSDMAFPKDRDLPYQIGLPWYTKTYNNNVKDYFKSWDAMYQVVFRANQVMEGLNSMDEDLKADERWTQQMAQARFFRGLMHFYLHSNYNGGSVVIRDKNPVTAVEFSKPLSTPTEVQDFFRADLLFAYENLPATFEEKPRVTAGTAATILGKSYLYSEEYTTAMTYLGDVINNSAYGYKLVEGEDVKTLFTSAGDYSSESIFEINYSAGHQTEEGTWDEESFFNRFARWFGPTGSIKGGALVVPAAWLTYAYSTETINYDDNRNYFENEASQLVPSEVSLRASQMIALVNDERSGYYGFPTANEGITFGGTTFSFFKKDTNHDIVSSEEDILETGWQSGKNHVVYRLADVILMYAECLISTGQEDLAIIEINKIRKRWGLILLEAADFDVSNTLEDHLRHVERPLELSNEGYAERSIDLRRWGIAKERYETLAAMDFNLIGYTTLRGRNRNKSLLQEGLSADPTDLTITIKEYEAAAEKYDSGLHDYLPLPTTEELYNQGAKN
jgi:hypothetical protein